MRYINSLKLTNLCIENNILGEVEGKIPVYRKGVRKKKRKNGKTPGWIVKPGWYLTDKDIFAKELMHSKKGQKIAISALNKKGIKFDLTDIPLLNI